MLVSWHDLVNEPLTETPFLVEPFIPRGGVVLLHGKYSTGKSPLTWELARCVGAGVPWLGHRVVQARVLYIEFDTPKILMKQRLAGTPAAPDVWWAFLPAYSSPGVLAGGQMVSPELVIVNTLRKCYFGSDIDSQTPSRVYSLYQTCFPNAALVFVHHDRKDYRGAGAPGREDEDFAGSQAWINDAQVALHVRRLNDTAYRVKHTKSQVSALQPPFDFRLTHGLVVQGTLAACVDEAVKRLGLGTMPKTEQVRRLAAELGVKDRAIWAALRQATEELGPSLQYAKGS